MALRTWGDDEKVTPVTLRERTWCWSASADDRGVAALPKPGALLLVKVGMIAFQTALGIRWVQS
jgi:hypothetical protein